MPSMGLRTLRRGPRYLSGRYWVGTVNERAAEHLQATRYRRLQNVGATRTRRFARYHRG